MAHKKSIIIIGSGTDAYVACASARAANEHARIMLIQEGSKTVSLHKNPRAFLLGHEENPPAIYDDEQVSARLNLEVLPNARALALDVDSQTLVLKHRNVTERIHYDALVYAAVGKPQKLAVFAPSSSAIAGFYTHDDLEIIKKSLSRGIRHVVVVGLGARGIQAAQILISCGVSVTIIHHKKRIMPTFSWALAGMMVEALGQLGITVVLDATIEQMHTEQDGIISLTLSSGVTLTTDLVISCIGVEPQLSLLTQAGCALDGQGLVVVDDHLLTTLPCVYACGLSVSVAKVVSNERLWMPHDAVIERLAQVAGNNAAALGSFGAKSIQPFCQTVLVAIGQTWFGRTGLLEHEARKAVGDDETFAVSSAAEGMDVAIKLVLNKASGLIIGAEVCGSRHIARILDVLAVAVHQEIPPDQLISVDLAEHPHGDPLKEVVMRAEQLMSEHLPLVSLEVLALWLASNRDFRMVDVDAHPHFYGGMTQKIVHMPLEQLRHRMDELAKERAPIVVCSRSGTTSSLAQKALIERGLTNVYQLNGGINTWKRA